MDFKQSALASLKKKRAQTSPKRVVVGLDGFVDTIVSPVDQRQGQGKDFSPIRKMDDFGRRISAAAGKSTNIELYPLMDKLGGNGPIMANAILAAGWQVQYIGALGANGIHPVFQDFASRAEVISLTDPACTTAIEFGDGKLMLGQMKSLDDVTYARIVETMGDEGLAKSFGEADLIALVNWTMIPNMSAIFASLIQDLLPKLPHHPRRFFFDLADPEKRSKADLLEALNLIGGFEKFGFVTLGLNLKEGQRIASVLDLPEVENSEASLKSSAAAIRDRLNINTVVLHPRESAACATAEGSHWVPGPYCEDPLITTGAGDHFNAGFSNGQLLGLSPQDCLALGVCTSGHYVRTAISPSLDDLESFLAKWN